MNKKLKKRLLGSTFSVGGLLALIIAFLSTFGLTVNSLGNWLLPISYEEGREKSREMDVNSGRLPADFLTSDNWVNTNYMAGQNSQHVVEGYNDTPNFDVMWRTKEINEPTLHLAPQQDPNGTKGGKFVILLHATANVRTAEYPYAWQWSLRNYNVVSYDQHGWGDSQQYGNATWGYYESRDVSRIVGEVEKLYAPSQIVISGDSMGAGTANNYATVYLNADQAKYKNTEFLIMEDSGYGSLEGQFTFLLNTILKIPGTAIWKSTGQWMNILNQMHYQDVVPLVNWADFTAPVLIIGGSADNQVPYSYSNDFFTKKVNAGQPAMYVNMQNASHVRSFSELGHDSTYNTVDAIGNNYFKYVDTFLQKYSVEKYKGNIEVDIPQTYTGINGNVETLVNPLERGDVKYKNETWGDYIGEQYKDLYKGNVTEASQIKNWDPNEKHYG